MNVLIPTDFTGNSLDSVNSIAKAMPEKMNIILFHAFDMPESLLDAMMRKGMNGHSNLVTEDLRLKCKRIKQQNKHVQNIYFRSMYGTTVAAFRNFAEANAIALIVLPAGYRYLPTVRESVNPLRMFQKSGIRLVTDLQESEARPDIDNSFFGGNMAMAN